MKSIGRKANIFEKMVSSLCVCLFGVSEWLGMSGFDRRKANARLGFRDM